MAAPASRAQRRDESGCHHEAEDLADEDHRFALRPPVAQEQRAPEDDPEDSADAELPGGARGMLASRARNALRRGLAAAERPLGRRELTTDAAAPPRRIVFVIFLVDTLDDAPNPNEASR